MKAAESGVARPGNIAEQISNQLGPCVLLPIPKGTKGPVIKGWQKLTRADMTPQFLSGFNGANIGVLLGKASDGLCTIDADSDDRLAQILEINPDLADTLQSRGQRGGNLWIRVQGDFPLSCKLKTIDGQDWGEWRADGNQTVFHGRHPSGCDYSTNGKKPIEIAFEEIRWPQDLDLPWQRAAEPDKQSTHPPGWIILPSEGIGNLESAQTAFRAMATSKRVFLRGGKVAELTKGGGALALDIIDTETLRSLIEMHGTVAAYRAGPHGERLLKVGAKCSVDTARLFLASPARAELPPVASLHACPLLVQDATGRPVVLPKGYHPHGGGKLITRGEAPNSIPLAEAVECLLSTLEEFSFATPADKSRALASILSPALVNGDLLGSHVPVFVVEADVSQSGKGYLLELAQRIYHEIPSLVGQRDKGVGGFDETLSQALINGRPFIQLDNLRGRLTSQFFEMILTTPRDGTVGARVPHRGEIPVYPSKVIFQLTSNGFESTADLANRSCIIRIKKRRGFTFRTFPDGGLIEHVIANQPRFLGAVYSIVGQWISEGKPRTADTRGEGRFRQWAQALDWIVQELCGLPPLMDGHQQAQSRAANSALSWLRQLALLIEAQAGLGQECSATRLVELSEDAGLPIPGIRDDAEEDQKARKVGTVLANFFRESPRMEVDSFTVERVMRDQYIESSRQTKSVPRYTFCNQSNQCNQSYKFL